MADILVVAEKPSVARDIARVLGAKSKGEGCLYGSGYVVTWAIGHLISLKEPEELNPQYKRWSTADLPILPEKMELKVLPKTRSQYSIVKKWMNSKEIGSLICATDSGREGELIFRYIYQMAGCKKPFQRLWISSMTDEAIRGGFAALRPGTDYDALYESARCRSEADWLVGMNASRAFTLRYNVLLSVGRVQTPTLEMLVRRRKEIDSFVSEPYFTVQADFGDYQGAWVNEKEKLNTHIKEKEQAEEIVRRVKGKAAQVGDVKQERKTDPAPQLYDLTTLQREASRRLGLTAQQTLNAAQGLYEKFKLITYPRTDSRYLSHDMAAVVPKTLAALGEPWKPLAAPLLQKPLPVTKRIFDDAKLTDHHAIIPTGKRTDPEKLPNAERQLYDMIVRRLIAAFYPPYLYDAARVLTRSEGETFLSEGRTVVQEGWRAVERGPVKEPEEKKTLPMLAQGDIRTVHKAALKQEQTKPPKEHTDASLLGSMEHAGRTIEDEALREQMKGCALGTPATRAAIIERLIKVGYARRRGRQIMATEKGVHLIQAVAPEIASPETTGKWEQALEKIARREGDSQRFMEGIRKLAAFLTDYAAKAPEVPFAPEERKRGRKKAAGSKSLGIPCPLCGQGTVTENSKAFGCSRWQEGCQYTVWKNAVTRQGGPELNAKLLKALLAAPNGRLRGSTGTLTCQNGRVGFEAFHPLT